MRGESIEEERKKSNIVGVSWDKRNKKWKARIRANSKNINLGNFATIEEAAEARRQGEIKYYGNTIDKTYNKKVYTTNKSGIVGVSWNTLFGVWDSKIGFGGKQYTLGLYENINEAKNIRKRAEQEILNGNFLEWYKETYKKE